MSDAAQTSPAPDPKIQQAIIANVAANGRTVTHHADPAVQGRSISVSVGFELNAGQPEVVVYGLDDELAKGMINETFRQCQEDGLELTDGQRIGNLIEGYDCMVRRIDNPIAIKSHFAFADWYMRSEHGGSISRGCQIVWPDPKSRKFPWEEGCAQDVAQWQTALYPMRAPK